MPGPDATPEEQCAFWQHQCAGAIALLRQKDATEEVCIARLDEKYRAHLKEVRERNDALKQRLQALEKRYGADVARYQLVRRHMVQIWKLGIAATAERLDELLDEQIKQPVHGSV